MEADLVATRLCWRAAEIEPGNFPVHDMEALTPCPRCGSAYIRFKRDKDPKIAVGVLALLSAK